MDQQHTIAVSASRSGVGVHAGEMARLTIRPAGAGEGVRFMRTDVTDRDNAILASALNVSTTMLGTNLTNAAGVSVATVEHFLAACAGLGIDNLVAELDGPELPILDGSSAPFVEPARGGWPCRAGGAAAQAEDPQAGRGAGGSKLARLSPGAGFEMRVAIDFPSKAIGRQTITFAMTPGAFARDVAWARTFGFTKDVEAMRSTGKALGGSLDNAIVVDGDAILNPGGLKAPDEFVRHKLLDVIGDLFLAGGPIEGLYEGEQPGHALNNRLLRAVFAETTLSTGTRGLSCQLPEFALIPSRWRAPSSSGRPKGWMDMLRISMMAGLALLAAACGGAAQRQATRRQWPGHVECERRCAWPSAPRRRASADGSKHVTLPADGFARENADHPAGAGRRRRRAAGGASRPDDGLHLFVGLPGSDREHGRPAQCPQEALRGCGPDEVLCRQQRHQRARAGIRAAAVSTSALRKTG